MLYQEFARIGKSFSSPKRLEVLDLPPQTCVDLSNQMYITLTILERRVSYNK
jgi:hypothetical protein